MTKFAICDDEPLMARELADCLAKYMEEKSITAYGLSSFPNGRTLLEAGGEFDVIFLDIQMEQPDGMETAKLLRQRGNHSLLVFVTVLMECVFDAFQVEAYDYLLKPLSWDNFHRTMDRVLRTLEQRAAEEIVIQRGINCEIVLLSDIVYCEVLGRKIYLHKKDGTVSDYYDQLEELERHMDGRFFRCHRSYLVNLKHLKGYKDGSAYMNDGSVIPVSRLRSKEFSAAILRCMKNM